MLPIAELKKTKTYATKREIAFIRKLGLSRNTQLRLADLFRQEKESSTEARAVSGSQRDSADGLDSDPREAAERAPGSSSTTGVFAESEGAVDERDGGGRQATQRKRRREIFVEDTKLEDAAAVFDDAEFRIRVNADILENDVADLGGLSEKRRATDAIIDEEVFHWFITAPLGRMETQKALLEAVFEEFVGTSAGVLHDAYVNYTRSHSPDLTEITYLDFIDNADALHTAFDELLRQMVQLEATGRLTEAVSGPWPGEDLAPGGWIAEFEEFVRRAYQRAITGVWGSGMQQIVWQAMQRNAR